MRQASELDIGRFGLAVRLSHIAADPVIYRAPAEDLANRAVSQNLLGIGGARDVIEVHGFSDSWLVGVDYDPLIVADAAPYRIRGSSPLATGKPWAIALDPRGEHKEFALFDVPLERFGDVRGLLLVETSALPNFPSDVLNSEVNNAA